MEYGLAPKKSATPERFNETLGECKSLNVPKLLMREEKNITYRLQHSRFKLESLWRDRDRDQSAHGCGTSR